VGKFMRRHRVGVAVSAVVAASLLIGGTAITYGFVKSSAERDEKVAALEREEAAREASDAVITFLSDMLGAVRPGREGPDVLLRDILDDAADRIDDFADHPLIEARLRDTIGRTYDSLSLYRPAERHLEAAMRIRERLLGEEAAETCTSRRRLANVFRRTDREAEARQMLLQNQEIETRVQGAPTVATLSSLANVYGELGRYEEAESLHRQVYESECREHGVGHPGTLYALANVGWILRVAGRLDEAEAILLEVVELRRKHSGNESTGTLYAMSQLASLYREKGRFTDAEELFEDVLEGRRRILGDMHAYTLTSIGDLGWIRARLGRHAEAQELFETLLERRRILLGETHSATVHAMNSLAVSHVYQGHNDIAEPIYIEALDAHRAAGRTAAALGVLHNLAILHEAQGRIEEAETEYRECLAGWIELRGEDSVDVARELYALADNLSIQGRHDEADPLFLEAAADLRRHLGDKQPHVLMAMADCVPVHLRRGDAGEADALAREILETTRAELDQLGVDYAGGSASAVAFHHGLSVATYQLAAEVAQLVADAGGRAADLSYLGWCQYRAGDPAAAVASLEQARQLREPDEMAIWPEDWAFAAMAHHRLGNAEQADAALARCRELMALPQNAANAEYGSLLEEAERLLAADGDHQTQRNTAPTGRAGGVP
jgi:tetratricopeptide (TPR) repeat protein